MFRLISLLILVSFTISCSENSTAPADTFANVTELQSVAGDGRATLSWLDPADEDFDHVEITFTPEVAEISQPITVLKDTQTESISGLTNGETYTFTVFSVNSSNIKSSGVTVHTLIGIPPANVTMLRAFPYDSRMRLTWVDPTDEDFDHVEITFTPEVVGISQPITVLKDTQTESISGLTNGETYTFTVVSVDSFDLKSGGVSISETPNVIPITEGSWRGVSTSDMSGSVSFTVSGNQLVGRKTISTRVWDGLNSFYPMSFWIDLPIFITDKKFSYTRGSSKSNVNGITTFRGTFESGDRCTGTFTHDEDSNITWAYSSFQWYAEPVAPDSSYRLQGFEIITSSTPEANKR